ncbi:MAG: carboxylating nicotinate-nucleotide diphosphorylase [Firmicutes bacterium]|nr:carboxylating nicotinate-nucleotide diphosphorylase [Bacillota bacterium]
MKLVIATLARQALVEDLGGGDLTTLYTIPPHLQGTGELIARQAGVIAGMAVAEQVFKILDERLKFSCLVEDGQAAAPGDVIARVTGRLRPILSAERTALNFLQQLSGIATRTRRWAGELKGTRARLVDTRKTVPGLRVLQKYAVRMGGGYNHRLGLDSGILIKDNHIQAAGGIREAVEAVRNKAPFTCKIEVEVKNLDELQEAIRSRVEIVMLDNMDTAAMARAVSIAGGRVLLEASGGIEFERLKEIAATGVDLISCGALTHSAPALDISLNVTGKN